MLPALEHFDTGLIDSDNRENISCDTSPNKRLSDLKYGLSYLRDSKNELPMPEVEQQILGQVFSVQERALLVA